MSRPLDLIVVGGGEHARVVMDAIRSNPAAHRLIGFVDPKQCEATVERLSVERLGNDVECLSHPSAKGARFVLGIGATGVSSVRADVTRRFEAAGAQFAPVVHATAFVSPTARLEAGAVVLGGAQVNTGAVIGPHVIVNTGAIVEHDVLVGGFAIVSPGAVIGGGCSIGDAAFLGLGCRVRDHLRVGIRAVVGMGAVVLGPVDDDTTVFGVPARAVNRNADA